MDDITAVTCPVCQRGYNQAYYDPNGNALGCNRCMSQSLEVEPMLEDTPITIDLLANECKDWGALYGELQKKYNKLEMENTKLKQEVKSLRGSVMRAWEDEAAKYIIEGAESQDPSMYKSEVPTFASIAFEFFCEYIVHHDAVKNSEILRPLAEEVENFLYSFYNKSAVELLDDDDETHDCFVKEEEDD